MAASLEARVPFLDRSLVEFALRLPAGQKVRLLKGKHLLRRLGLTLIPPSLSWRRKHGFLVPWEEWLRSPRSALIADALASPALRDCGLLEAGRMRADLEALRRGGGSEGVDRKHRSGQRPCR
jgi:asparagine synthase (glutamine-hydrolysing)